MSERRSVPEQLSLPWVPPVDRLPLPAILQPDLTLASAQESFKEGLHSKKGTSCPCCGKHGKKYNRTLNSTMVRALIWLVRQSGASREWINVQETGPAWMLRSKQHPTLRYWKLIERKEKDPEDSRKRKSGIFRPTTRGIDFVYGKIRVPRQVHEYRGQVLGYSADETHIRRALGEEFDYYELMGWDS